MQPFPEIVVGRVDQETGIWPLQRNPILDWLVNDTHSERYVDDILVELCRRLVDMGLPLARASLHFRIHHPQWLGARVLWRTGMTKAQIGTFDYGMEKSAFYLHSPANEIHTGAVEVRQKLEIAPSDGYKYPLYDELCQEGMTDYVAWPLNHTFGKRHIVTFASEQAGGFDDGDIAVLRDILPALALVTEIRLKNILARTLLETYVGPHASEQILAGATKRGSGASVSAAIMICDLRDFSGLSDLWPRDDVIDLLNGYFDAISKPIEDHGGEILKFMGDGLLAIFPLSNPDACHNLMQAIIEGQAAMARLNVENQDKGHPALGYGVGVHVGDVMYGNIGSRTRLDFTVIGPAVNAASRLEALTKEVKRTVLVSKTFAEMAGCEADVDHLGSFPLRGIGEPMDIYAFRE